MRCLLASVLLLAGCQFPASQEREREYVERNYRDIEQGRITANEAIEADQERHSPVDWDMLLQVAGVVLASVGISVPTTNAVRDRRRRLRHEPVDTYPIQPQEVERPT